ncbi:MAG: archaetidylserine decarboxylase [Candidatus Malihini olakiniferum]
MMDKLKIALQYWLPKIALTRLVGWGADKQAGRLTNGVIDLFVRYYKVNMQEAQHPDTTAYRTFNDFFVRPLRPDVRSIDPHAHRLVQPADGVLSQMGTIVEGKLIQAKGHNYSLEALLAGNYMMAEHFRDGLFATTYLSPRDYHRVHMPCDGVLREMIYVPGELFSVNLFTADNVPNLFTRNERVICLFDTDFGPMVQILVGATIVGSIETVWSGTVTPPSEGIIKRWTYPAACETDAITLKKGEEMGLFKLGSTVINLFAPNKLQFAAHLNIMGVTRVGEPFAEARMADSSEDTLITAESVQDMADQRDQHSDDTTHHTP